MSAIKDLTGQRFVRLEVVDYSHNNEYGRAVWNCVCDCGKTLKVKGNALLSGNTKSCGCLRNDKIAKVNFKHGQRNTRLYGIWQAMRTRCYNENFAERDRYSKRGVVVCEDWQEFMPFYEWAMANGYRDDLTIERIDNDGNYCPENCRWATRKEQANNTSRNRFITFNGETHTVAEWSAITSIQYGTLLCRITELGWSAEKALTTPIKQPKGEK